MQIRSILLGLLFCPMLVLAQSKIKGIDLLVQQHLDLKAQLAKTDEPLQQKYMKAEAIYNRNQTEYQLILKEGSNQEINFAILLYYLNTYQFGKSLYLNRLFEQSLLLFGRLDENVRAIPKTLYVEYNYQGRPLLFSYDQDIKELQQTIDLKMGICFAQLNKNKDAIPFLKKFLASNSGLVYESYMANNHLVGIYNFDKTLKVELDYAQSLYQTMYWYHQLSPAQKDEITKAHPLPQFIKASLELQREYGYGADQPVFQNASRMIDLYNYSKKQEPLKDYCCKIKSLIVLYDKNSKAYIDLLKICP